VHTKNVPLSENVALDVIAKGTPGFSGADLANLVNEAALLAARHNKKVVDMREFEYAKDKVMMGTERKSMIITEEEKRETAYHEAGHVIVAVHVPKSDPVHKVTIIPRGRALGLMTSLPDEKHNYSKTYLESRIATALGGRVAEKLVMNELTFGAANDLEKAADIARKMVCEWGMSEKLGPLTFGKKEEEIFLGREIAQHRDYSERTAQIIEEEVTKRVEKAEKLEEDILKKHIDHLHTLAASLLEREVLDGAEIKKILSGETLPVKVEEDEELKQPAKKTRAKKAAVVDI